jgi:membrane protease YdiL (CAAX protease family)
VLTEGELIKKKVPNVWKVFWSYAIVILVVGVLSYGLFEGEGEQKKVHTLIFGSVCILLTTIVFEVIFWRSLVVQLKQFGFLKAEVWLGFLVLTLLLILNFGYRSFLIYLLGEESKPDLWLYKTNLSGGAMFVLLCLIPGITEEIAFRGLIQHWLHTVLRPWRAILLASALFTALHLSVVSAPYIFLLGILLGWVKWQSRSLYPSILMHIAHNWVIITVFPLLIVQ